VIVTYINYTIVIGLSSWWDGGAWRISTTPSLLSCHRSETAERERDVRDYTIVIVMSSWWDGRAWRKGRRGEGVPFNRESIDQSLGKQGGALDCRCSADGRRVTSQSWVVGGTNPRGIQRPRSL